MSMEVGNDAEWIISRKIVVKSLTRHFAPWKSRFFVLDRAQALLGVRSSSNDALLVISLAAPSLSIQRHEYSVDEQYLLTLKYKDEDSPTSKEVVMKFDSLGHLTYWEKALQSAAANVRSVTATSTRALFNTFLEYVNEQSQLQRIVQAETEGGARYYQDTATDSEARILTDDAVDSTTSSFMSSSAGSVDNNRTEHKLTHGATISGTTTKCADLACDHITLADSDLQDGALAARIQMKPLNIPHMRILLVAVGTRGDMQPFVQLGLRLQRDGHRVRLATHACFRESVTSKGLEFYPLAGDPLKLSEFMVKTQGFVIPTTPELLLQAPIYHQMVVDMMYSCWGACVDPDPADPAARKFVADAIISNPVSYAHIHCAEALGIPLHLMFPQPWTPTKAFPHPLSCLSYQQGWSAENFISYQLVDSMLWMSFERQINAFRMNVLGLEPLRVGEGGWNHLNIMKVPFVKMWSPSFVPKPKDWPSHVDVVGTFFDALPKAIAAPPMVTTAPTGAAGGASKITSPFLDVDYTPPADLMRFLAAGDTPVFVGFGSMVIKDLEGLISLFLEGAALAGVRIIVQVGWSSIKPERFLELALQAQLKASIVRETELMNDNMASSLIFPSSKPPAKARTAGSDKVGVPSAGASSVVDLSMSMRSVQSTSTVDSCEGDDIPDESTLDGERVSVGTRESESGRMYTSSITGSVANSAYRAHSSDKDELAFDSSPISSPARIPSVERKQASVDATSASAGGESKSGLGNWLIGAAMNLSKTFTPTNQSQGDPRTNNPVGDGLFTTQRVDSADENDISASWDEVAGDSWSAAKDAYFMGPCPHDWLFQRVAGVVHHGGAGTTAAGLRFGCPTWICPFFGDQHFWGEMVHRRQVGPRPCPIGALTLPIVADSLAALKDQTIIHNAAALADSMRQEDGVEGACAAFYKHLPVENMVCDVSLYRGEYRLAQVYCQDCGFKMCKEVSQQLHADPSLHMQDHRVGPCCYKDWTRHGPHSAAEGLLQGIGGLVHELKEGVSDILYDPVRGIYTEGISGAAAGLSTGLNSLLSRPLAGGSVLLNKVKEGIRASLASNLNYRVKASPYDPLSADGGNYALVDKVEAERNNTGGSSPLVPKAQLTTPARALKLALPEMPPVLASVTTEEFDAFSPGPSAAFPTLSDSPQVTQANNALLNAAPVSPRNANTANLLEMSALERSIRSTASRDSSAFYGSKDKEGADAADSDGDESVYYEEENIPFLLYTSDTLMKHPMKQLSSQALSSSTPSSGSSNVGIQTAGTRNNSDSAADTSLPDPDSTPVNASPPALSAAGVTLALPADALVLDASPVCMKLQARRATSEAPTVREAFEKAQMAQKLFRNLGAENGRFIAPRQFGKVMHRAILRDTALTAIDAVDAITTVEALAAPAHSSPLHAYAKHKKLGEVNETSTNALIQMLAHGKRYVDFVDFSLIYMELCAVADDK